MTTKLRIVLVSTAISLFGVYAGLKLLGKYKKYRKRQSYPRDIVILHQFPRALRAPSASNYCLKLETWLRMTQIPYYNDLTFEFSKKGKMPWITFISKDEDTDVADSEFCIEYLSNKFNKKLNTQLSDRENGIANAFRKMVEESFDKAFALHRYIYRVNFQESSVPMFYALAARKKVIDGSQYQGYGRHSMNEVYQIGKKDLKSINDMIGENKYIMGDKLCNEDASVFGSLCQVIYHSRGEYYDYVHNECPNILRYVERIKSEFWPDWNECIIEKSQN